MIDWLICFYIKAFREMIFLRYGLDLEWILYNMDLVLSHRKIKEPIFNHINIATNLLEIFKVQAKNVKCDVAWGYRGNFSCSTYKTEPQDIQKKLSWIKSWKFLNKMHRSSWSCIVFDTFQIFKWLLYAELSIQILLQV